MVKAAKGVKWSQSKFKSEFGPFDLYAFEFPNGKEHAVLVVGAPEDDKNPLVRVSSACLTATAFLAVLCDCRQQLHLALQEVQKAGSGVVLYLDQEGRSHGLVGKVEQFAAMNKGKNTVEAAEFLHVEPDLRDYEDAAEILKALSITNPVRLLTNNPKKLKGMEEAGVKVAERVPLETEPSDTNRDYLKVKKEMMGHLLCKV